MASSNETVSMALFCDFENVALGVRDAKYEKFDIKLVLERLLLKGSIVVKKAYCDWDRYKSFKGAMHEANFELIEIPHVRQSGKNSADIRLVVDALDLCYTKSHVNTFVIISGDSDFSPLVSKLRENAKQVIGVGVKNSTSDLLIANCDEFIFYDDLVRESQRTIAKREAREARKRARRTKQRPNGKALRRRKPPAEARTGSAARRKAVEIAVETFDALASERGDSGKIWASVLKNAIKRRKPDFNESYFGFRAFGNLLEEAQARGLLEFGRDEKSGAFVFRASSQGGGEGLRPQAESDGARAVAKAEQGGKRRKGRGERNQAVAGVEAAGLEAQGDVLEAGHGGNRRKDRDGRRPTAVVVEAETSQSQDDADTDEHGGNDREDRDAREETWTAAEAVTSQSQSEADAGEAGVAPQAEHGGNRRKDRDARRQAPVVSEAVTPEAQADVEEAGAEAHTGQRGNRRKDRHGRGQTPAFVESVESDETQAVEWFDAVQALGTETVGVPVAQDDAPFAVEPRESAKASKPAARRGRKTAAKKAAASAEPTVQDTASTAWLFADDEAPPPEAEATPLAEPGKPSRKAARKSAPRARRPRKTVAGSEE